jgi:predicted dithiol-disulfide oxidoreductase (DUF899 family)
MVHEIIDGTYRQTNLTNEPHDYLAAREQLRLAEIELMKQRERVAAMRRALPKGAVVKDYEFLEGPRDLDAGDAPVRKIKLSELFSSPNRPLVLYQFMYGKKNAKPCPMCTLWIDGMNGVAHHIAQNIDFAIVAAADPATLRAHARARGWDNLRLISAGDSTFKYDLGGESADGGQDSTLNVFSKDADGTIRHFYTCHPKMSPEINERGIDLLVPVYNMLDFTPQGRGGWYASFAYPPKVNSAGAA